MLKKVEHFFMVKFIIVAAMHWGSFLPLVQVVEYEATFKSNRSLSGVLSNASFTFTVLNRAEAQDVEAAEAVS